MYFVNTKKVYVAQSFNKVYVNVKFCLKRIKRDYTPSSEMTKNAQNVIRDFAMVLCNFCKDLRNLLLSKFSSLRGVVNSKAYQIRVNLCFIIGSKCDAINTHFV